MKLYLALIIAATYAGAAVAQTGAIAPLNSGDHGTTWQHAEESKKNVEASKAATAANNSQPKAAVRANVPAKSYDTKSEAFDFNGWAVPGNPAFGRIGTR